MSIKNNIHEIISSLPPNATLIAVTKTHPVEKLEELYETGHRLFGENKVQEMVDKYEKLPKDIQWHLIGHLQTNKVKFIAPFVSLIHSVDSFNLLKEINKQATKNNRIINCLLQIYIAKEESKFGLDYAEAEKILNSKELSELKNIKIIGLMGMASNNNYQEMIAKEFNQLNNFYTKHKNIATNNIHFSILCMGMSNDYMVALQNGSNMVRIGSKIFGERQTSFR
ncbi:MAG: YggS family pyridoxal phosphate-dependent enzyme [Bacteroidia bacterium]